LICLLAIKQDAVLSEFSFSACFLLCFKLLLSLTYNVCNGYIVSNEEVGEVEEAAAPESSRTTQNQGASTTTVATSLISQQPTSQMVQ
jgi:hypothetical protein